MGMSKSSFGKKSGSTQFTKKATGFGGKMKMGKGPSLNSPAKCG
jgi:hypothetical protein